MCAPITIDTPQRCKLCGGVFTIRALLNAVSSFWPALDVVFSESPCCHRSEELRLESGRVWRGYTYAAGSPHFCGMEEYEVPRLVVARDGPILTFELDGTERVVRPRD